MTLDWMLYIHYLFRFQKDITGIRALVDLGNDNTAITLAYAAKLGLKV